MPEFHLSLSYNPLLIAVAGALSAGLAVVAYRFTVPPLPRSLKVMLGALRGSALFLLFLLLGSPIVSLVHRSEEPAGILVLVDNSRSMTLTDRSGVRSEELKRVLTSSEVRRLENLGNAAYASFDITPRLLSPFQPDSLNFSGPATDITSALQWIQVERRGLDDSGPEALRNLRAVLLISDGVVTMGMNPVFEVEALGLPVFTIGLGDTVDRRDVQIRDLATNALAYKGNRVPVKVTVRSTGAGGERVEVRLLAGGKTVDRQTVLLGSGVQQQEVHLSFVADSVGMQRLTAEVSAIPNELTRANNRQSVSVRVLESKMRVLMVAGAPSPDAAVVRRLLGRDQNVELRALIQQKDGSFAGGEWNPGTLEKTDCVVLVGFPETDSPPAILRSLAALGERLPALLVVWSRTLDLSRLRLIDDLLPVTVPTLTGAERQVQIAIPPATASHPLFEIAGEREGSPVWSQMPPVFSAQMTVHAKPDARILAVVQSQNRPGADPFIVVRSAPRGKSLVVLGYGLWRWKMLGGGVPGGEQVLDSFLSNALRWLTAREDARRVRVAPVQESFSSGNPVEFRAQVYDESLQPVDEAQVQVSLRVKGQPVQVLLTPKGTGQYEGTFEGLPEGTYQYDASAMVGGRLVGTDRGTVTVEESAVEFLRTTMDRQLLQLVAQRSGGKFYDAEELQNLPRDIQALSILKPVELSQTSELRLMSVEWMLALVVLLLSVEWLIRKRNGML